MSYIVDAVVAAAGPIHDDFHGRVPSRWEALLKVGGRACLRAVVEGLRGSSRVDKVWVAAPEAVRGELDDLEVGWLEPASRGYLNMLAGLHHVTPGRMAIMTVCDLPFADAAGITAFLDRCDPSVPFTYGVTERGDMEKCFPGFKRLYVPVREGRFTGSCLGLVNPKEILDREQSFAMLFNSRKNTFAIARKLGWDILVGRMRGKLPLATVCRSFSKTFNIEVDVVTGVSPFWSLDVDSFEDFDYACWWHQRYLE